MVDFKLSVLRKIEDMLDDNSSIICAPDILLRTVGEFTQELSLFAEYDSTTIQLIVTLTALTQHAIKYLPQMEKDNKILKSVSSIKEVFFDDKKEIPEQVMY